MSGQPHSLTALFPGKNIPHWPLDVRPLVCLEVMEKKKIFLSYIMCGFKWCRYNVTSSDFQHYNTPLQQAHFSAYMFFIFCANIGWYPAAGVLFVHCNNKHSTPTVGCKPTVGMKMKYVYENVATHSVVKTQSVVKCKGIWKSDCATSWERLVLLPGMKPQFLNFQPVA